MTKINSVNRDEKLVQTSSLRHAYASSLVMLKTNRIAFFDGPPGTGKTTAALAVAQKVDRPSAMMTMSFRPANLDVLRNTIGALTGIQGSGTKSQMEDELIYLFQDWNGLLIVDEVQNCGAAGIQTLRYLHDRSGCSFALLLVGWQALETIRTYPDLQSRVISEVIFEPLSGEELYSCIRQCHSVLENVEQPLLQHIDSRYARGILRNWRNVAETVEAIGIEQLANRAEADEILNLLSRST